MMDLTWCDRGKAAPDLSPPASLQAAAAGGGGGGTRGCKRAQHTCRWPLHAATTAGGKSECRLRPRWSPWLPRLPPAGARAVRHPASYHCRLGDRACGGRAASILAAAARLTGFPTAPAAACLSSAARPAPAAAPPRRRRSCPYLPLDEPDLPGGRPSPATGVILWRAARRQHCRLPRLPSRQLEPDLRRHGPRLALPVHPLLLFPEDFF